MTIRLLIILSICLCPAFLYGQKQNNIWAFGTQAGLDFNTAGNPRGIATAIKQWEGCSSIADAATGKLLFYTDGNTVWNANNQIMPSGIIGVNTYSTTEGALITPVINSPRKYYIFSLEDFSTPDPKLYYSIVDMSLNGGLGDIVANQKRIFLEDSLTEAMAAVSAGCNGGYWLLVHARYDKVFKAFHITSAGINTKPVMSIAGSATKGVSIPTGIIRIAPNGKKITFHNQLLGGGSPTENRLTLFDFDLATGIVSNPIEISSRDFYGVCFSWDNTKLYAATQGGNNIRLYQYDLSSGVQGTIQASEINLGPITGRNDLQRGPDGKIYLAGNSATKISRIDYPNLIGTACSYNQNVIVLAPGTRKQLGLPNFLVGAILEKDTISSRADTLICANSVTPIELKVPTGFTNYTWEDGSSSPNREVSKPGIYWVLASTDTGCAVDLDSFIIHSGPDLGFSLGPDTVAMFCSKAFVNLQVNIPYANYQWQDNSTSNYYHATHPGIFWVKVSKNGCSAADTVKIDSVALDLGPDLHLCKGDPIDFTFSVPPVPGSTITQWSNGSSVSTLHVMDTGVYWLNLIHPPCILQDTVRITMKVCDCFVDMPNAFTPNGDGKNDFFMPVIESGCPVKDYALSIYNRFGQRIFYSTDPKRGWDGNCKGQPSEIGTYFYQVHFIGGIRQENYDEKGDLTLIR